MQNLYPRRACSEAHLQSYFIVVNKFSLAHTSNSKETVDLVKVKGQPSWHLIHSGTTQRRIGHGGSQHDPPAGPAEVGRGTAVLPRVEHDVGKMNFDIFVALCQYRFLVLLCQFCLC